MAPSATLPNTEYASNENGWEEKSLKAHHSNDHGKEYGRALTKAHLKRRIEGINTDTCDVGEEDAFFVADMGEVYRQHLRWKLNLKRVKPHYGKSFLSHLKTQANCCSCQV